MNAKSSTFRRLLPLALGCGLFVVAASASEAQGCADLYVFVGSTAASSDAKLASSPSCDHGYYEGAFLPNSTFAPGVPLVVILRQSDVYGPACQITLSGPDGTTAVLSVQQNYCGGEAGDVAASVVSGPATFVYKTAGSYADNFPGMAWFTINF